MSQAGDAPNVVVSEAWWDPQKRKVVFNPSTFNVGVVVASADLICYSSASRGPIFALPLRDTTLKWMSHNMSVLVTTSEVRERLYFAPPIKGVPRLSKQEKIDLVEPFTFATTAADLLGATGTVFELLDTLSQTLDLGSKLGESVALVKNAKEYRRIKSILTLAD